MRLGDSAAQKATAFVTRKETDTLLTLYIHANHYSEHTGSHTHLHPLLSLIMQPYFLHCFY